MVITNSRSLTVTVGSHGCIIKAIIAFKLNTRFGTTFGVFHCKKVRTFTGVEKHLLRWQLLYTSKHPMSVETHF